MEKNFVVGGTPRPSSIIIRCERIKLYEKNLDIEIDFTHSYGKIQTIIVNGVEFVRNEKGGGDNV